MKTDKMTVETVRHTDVRGKQLLYINIGGHLINVGDKTWSAVNALIINQTAENVSHETEEKTKRHQIK